MDIEEPVSGWNCSTLHFHATLAGMLSATLIRNQVIEVRESREKRLLTATGMVKPFHRKELPLDGVMGLIQQGTHVQGVRLNRAIFTRERGQLGHASVLRYDAVGNRRRQEGHHGHDNTADSSRSTLAFGPGSLTAPGGGHRD